jgi:hypothetical protein
VAGIAVPASAYPRPGRTELVSVSLDGGGADGISTGGDLSADGRFVAFNSNAPDLVPEKTNRRQEAFVRDRVEGVVHRVAVSSEGVAANSTSFASGISSNGRYVVFTSGASNLVPDDTNGATDTFVRDLVAGTTERASVAADGTEADRASQNATISANGRYVAFASRATNLVEGGANGELNIFVKDRIEGDVYLASQSSEGVQGNASSFFPALSAEGRYVAFQSNASNLVPNDTNGRGDVFVHDIVTRETERVSVAWNGQQANDSSNRAGISADGRYVVFASHATNLVPNSATPNIFPGDIYVRDRQRRTTERVSTTSAGEVGDRSSFTPQISPDGRYVIFTSIASNLVRRPPANCPPSLTNLALCRDVFLHDRELVRTERVSLGQNDVQGDGPLSVGSTTPDASTVAFFGMATNFVTGVEGEEPDVFVRTRGRTLDSVDLRALPSTTGARVTGGAVFSGERLSESPTRVLLIQDSGIEIQNAQLLYHPEEGELLFRWRLNGMQTMPTPRGPWPFQYLGFTFTTPTGRWEIRIQDDARVDLPSLRPFATRVELYRCEDSCVHVADLPGSFGTTGPEARAALPLKTVGLDETDPITGLRAYMAVGHRAAGQLGQHQGADLPNTEIPRKVVRVGASSPDTSPDQVPMSPVELDDGRFDVTLDFPGGESRVWIRVCLGSSCVLNFLDVEREAPEGPHAPAETHLSVVLAPRPGEVVSAATLSDAAGGTGVAGRTINFDVNGNHEGSALTASDGTASIAIPRSRIKPGDVVTARFAGDDDYLPAEASARFNAQGPR